ncbi:DedA family protein [Desulfofalx alkaliphila]|uniref:DedA family protein n=1 Tax=Desulfofalx alkaliphila TaxID=105483 RepID=UPI00068B8D95|nr:DedA family protein [Desulfofalx alkaliphila]
MEQIIDTLLHYLIRLGSLGLMFAIFLDALGLPFPGGLMIVMSGFLIHRGDFSPMEVAIAIFAGYLPGATAAYFIGDKIGKPFFEKYGRYLRVTPQRFNKAQGWIEHSAAAFIIGGRFIPTLGNLTPYMAGISKVKYHWFLFYSTLYTLLWAGLYITVGYIFRDSWQQAGEMVTSKSWLVAVLFLLIYLAYRYYFKRKEQVR